MEVEFSIFCVDYVVFIRNLLVYDILFIYRLVINSLYIASPWRCLAIIDFKHMTLNGRGFGYCRNILQYTLYKPFHGHFLYICLCFKSTKMGTILYFAFSNKYVCTTLTITINDSLRGSHTPSGEITVIIRSFLEKDLPIKEFFFHFGVNALVCFSVCISGERSICITSPFFQEATC